MFDFAVAAAAAAAGFRPNRRTIIVCIVTFKRLLQISGGLARRLLSRVFDFRLIPHPSTLLTTRQQLGRYAFSFASFIICLIFWRPFSYIVMTSQPYTVGFRSIDRFVYIIILYYIPLCMCMCICICISTQSSILLDNIIHSQIVCTLIHYSCNVVSLQFDFI